MKLGSVALALIALSVLVKATIVGEAFFKQDDFEVVARAIESDLTWEHLFRVHHGRLMPGGFLLAWVLTHIAPYSWGLVTVVNLLGHALAGLAVLHMLTVLFGRRWGVLAPLTIFLFSALTVPVTSWWAASLTGIPLLIALPMAVAAHVEHLRDGAFRPALRAFAWILFGLAFSLKAAVIPLLLLALTLVHFRDRTRTDPRTWVLYGTALAGYVALSFALGATGAMKGSGLPQPLEGLELAWRLLGQTLATSVLGGPWRWFAASDWATASPPALAVIPSLVILAALVALTVRYRRRAVWAWAILLGYVLLADLLPALAAWDPLVGGFAGGDARYLADAVPVLALVVGLLTMPVQGEAEPYSRPLPGREVRFGLGGLLLGGFLTASLMSVSAFGAHLGAPDKVGFLANARQALAKTPADQPIFDRQAPEFLVPAGYGEYAMTSRVVAPLASPQRRQSLYRPPAAPDGLVFDDQGQLKPVAVEGMRVSPPQGPCWKPSGTSVEVPLHTSVAPGGLVRLGTYAPAQARATLVLGTVRQPVVIREGLTQIYFTAPPGLGSVQLTELTQGVDICFGDVTVGKAVVAR